MLQQYIYYIAYYFYYLNHCKHQATNFLKNKNNREQHTDSIHASQSPCELKALKIDIELTIASIS